MAVSDAFNFIIIMIVTIIVCTWWHRLSFIWFDDIRCVDCGLIRIYFSLFFFFGHCCCFWCSLTSILNTNFIRWHRIGAALFRSLHHNFIALFSLHFLRHFLIFLSFVTLSTLSHTQYHFINFKRYFCILFSCHNETQDFLLNYFQFIFSRKLITDDKWMII